MADQETSEPQPQRQPPPSGPDTPDPSLIADATRQPPAQQIGRTTPDAPDMMLITSAGNALSLSDAPDPELMRDATFNRDPDAPTPDLQRELRENE